MLRAGDDVLAALATLHGNSDFQTVKNWIRGSMGEDAGALFTATDEVLMRRLQGSIQTLSSLLDVADNAMDIVHRKRNK